MISCILLSAGESQRFGSPKALAKINNQAVIERLVQALVYSKLDEIIIVLGANAEQITPYILKHKKIKVVYNKDYILGQTSSFQAGLREVSSQALGFMLLPVDYPLIKAETINFLVEEFEKNTPFILIPSYQNKKGHPPIFSSKLKQEFLALDAGDGLNMIQRCHNNKVKIIEIEDAGVVKSFNTRQEFEKLAEPF